MVIQMWNAVEQKPDVIVNLVILSTLVVCFYCLLYFVTYLVIFTFDHLIIICQPYSSEVCACCVRWQQADESSKQLYYVWHTNTSTAVEGCSSLSWKLPYWPERNTAGDNVWGTETSKVWWYVCVCRYFGFCDDIWTLQNWQHNKIKYNAQCYKKKANYNLCTAVQTQ